MIRFSQELKAIAVDSITVAISDLEAEVDDLLFIAIVSYG